MNKQLLIGILLGVAICLTFQLLPQAQAQVKQPVARYQMAADTDNFNVIDQFTGDVFHIKWDLQKKRWHYRQIVTGPPR